MTNNGARFRQVAEYFLGFVSVIFFSYILISQTYIHLNGKYNQTISKKKNTGIDESKLVIRKIRKSDIVNVVTTIPRVKLYRSRKLKQITTIIIHHSGTDNQMETPRDIALVGIKRFGYSHSYHFQIDSDGTIYKTNWISSITAHVKNYNTPSIGILVAGNFEDSNPSLKSIQSLIMLIRYLKISIPSITKVIGHRDKNATKCPGKNLYNLIPLIREKSKVSIKHK